MCRLTAGRFPSGPGAMSLSRLLRCTLDFRSGSFTPISRLQEIAISPINPHCFKQRDTFLPLRFCKFNDEDAILRGQTDQHDHADLRIEIKCQTRQNN